jgi:hypothetical protein
MKRKLQRDNYLSAGKSIRDNVLQEYGGTEVSNQKTNNDLCVNYKVVNPETNMHH